VVAIRSITDAEGYKTVREKAQVLRVHAGRQPVEPTRSENITVT